MDNELKESGASLTQCDITDISSATGKEDEFAASLIIHGLGHGYDVCCRRCDEQQSHGMATR